MSYDIHMGSLPRKSRKTFSLSRETTAYLETYRARRKDPSLSAAVEAIIRERRQQEEADKLAAQTRAYYDSLPPAELAEQDPKARQAKPEDFLDMRFVAELDKAGFFKKLQ